MTNIFQMGWFNHQLESDLMGFIWNDPKKPEGQEKCSKMCHQAGFVSLKLMGVKMEGIIISLQLENEPKYLGADQK